MRRRHSATQGAAHARHGHLADTAGAIATAACQAAHAVLAARGQWVTNEKSLLERAGLRGVDALLAGLTGEPDRLLNVVDATETLLRAATAQPGRRNLVIVDVVQDREQ